MRQQWPKPHKSGLSALPTFVLKKMLRHRRTAALVKLQCGGQSHGQGRVRAGCDYARLH